jgi:hypothetical protein
MNCITAEPDAPAVEELFSTVAMDILSRGQAETIAVYHHRDDMDSPVYILLDDDRNCIGMTTSSAEAKVQFHQNKSVRSYIASGSLLAE